MAVRNSHTRPSRRELSAEILAELYETTPTNLMTMPDPYDSRKTLEQNVIDLFYQLRWSLRAQKRIEGLVSAFYLGQFIEQRPLTPEQRARCRGLLTKHYICCCQRIFDLFSIQGIAQIYRTKRVYFWYFSVLSKREFVRLIQEAENML